MPFSLAITAADLVPNTNGSTYKYSFPSGGVLFKGNEIALQSASLYYSWINISAALNNNTFSYVFYSGAGPTATTVNITVPDGFYSIAELNAYLQSIMVQNGHYLITSTGDYVYFLEMTTNATLYAVQLNCYFLPTAAQAATNGWTAPGGWPGFVTTNICPQFIIPATNIENLLGINSGTYPSPNQPTNYSKTSDFTPQVTPVQSVFILCSLVNNRYGIPNSIIYNFAPANTSYGSLIQIQPPTLVFSDIQDGQSADFTIQFVDQTFQPLAIKDTNISVLLCIKEKAKI